MDTAVSTLKRNIHNVENACYFSYSNGPIEGINRKIKELKRHRYGFRNLNNFFNHIDCIFLLNLKVLHQYDLTKSHKFAGLCNGASSDNSSILFITSSVITTDRSKYSPPATTRCPTA